MPYLSDSAIAEVENEHANRARIHAASKIASSRTTNNNNHLKVQATPDSPPHEMESPLPTRSGVSAFSGIGSVEMKPFEIESHLVFQPPGAWQTILNTSYTSSSSSSSSSSKEISTVDTYHISTTFLSPGFIVSCPAGADRVKIDCAGVASFKVLYTRDEDNSNSSGVILSDLKVPVAEDGRRQRVEVKTPWPCMKVEAVVKDKADDFVTIFDVCVYSTLRPSSQSTPINNKSVGREKIW